MQIVLGADFPERQDGILALAEAAMKLAKDHTDSFSQLRCERAQSVTRLCEHKCDLVVLL